MSQTRFTLQTLMLVLAVATTSTGFSMTPEFKAEHMTRSKAISIPLPMAQALEWFTPEGEKKWAVGWAPKYLNSPSGAPGTGLVFVTQHGGHETVWTMTQYEPIKGYVEYVRTSTDAWHATIRVALKPTSKHASEATVSYQYTGLSQEGNKYIRDMDEQRYAEFVGSWESDIKQALSAQQN